MSEKKEMKDKLDSVVLGISGEALLVMGLIVAFANKPQWNSVLTLALTAVGIFLVVWGFVLSEKRKAAGEGTLTVILAIMGVLSIVFGLLGYFKVIGVFIPGIAIAIIGVASDIVLATVAKKDK